MKKSIFLSFCLLIGFYLHGQESEKAFNSEVFTVQNEERNLSFKSTIWSYNYYIGSQRVSYDTFRNKLNESNVINVNNMFNSGKNISIAGNIIGSIGAFCVGFDLGTRLGGNKGNTALLAGGGGVMLGGIIMYYAGAGKMKKALTLYKDNVATLYVSPTQTGIGLCFNF